MDKEVIEAVDPGEIHTSVYIFHLSQIGPKWKDVVSRCIKGHYQPLLLLYADPRGTPVSAQDSPPLPLSRPCYDSEDSGNYNTARSRASSSSTAASLQVTDQQGGATYTGC